MATKKIYCYIDESGQDTKGELFIVSVVVAGNDKDILQNELEQIEKDSGKHKYKWGKTNISSRLKYLQKIVSNKKYKYSIFFSKYKTMDFDLAAIQTISKTVHYKTNKHDYKTSVYIDGLAKSKRHFYAKELRNLGVRTQKIKGVMKDENNSLIRLADAISGWIRDVIEQNIDDDLSKVYRKGIKNKVLVEI